MTRWQGDEWQKKPEKKNNPKIEIAFTQSVYRHQYTQTQNTNKYTHIHTKPNSIFETKNFEQKKKSQNSIYKVNKVKLSFFLLEFGILIRYKTIWFKNWKYLQVRGRKRNGSKYFTDSIIVKKKNRVFYCCCGVLNDFMQLFVKGILI